MKKRGLLFFLLVAFCLVELKAQDSIFLWNVNPIEKNIQNTLNTYLKNNQLEEAKEYLLAKKDSFLNLLFYRRQYLEILYLQEKERELLNTVTDWYEKSDDANYLFLRAMFLYRLHYRISAYEDFSAAYKAKGQNSPITEFLYYYYLNIQSIGALLPLSERLLETILQTQPNASLIWYEKSKTQIKLRKYELAYIAMQQAIIIEPKKEYYNQILEIERAYFPDKYPLRLLDLMEKYPIEIRYFQEYSRLQNTLDKKLSWEQTLKENLAKRNQDNTLADFYALLAEIQQELGKEEALQNFRKAFQLKKSIPLMFSLARALWIEGEKDEAANYFLELKEKEEKNFLIFFALGNYYKDKRQIYSAEKFILEGLEYYPDNIALLELYIKNLEIQGRYLDAIEVSKELLQKFPKNPIFLQSIGIWYAMLGEYTQAEAYLKKSLEIENKETTRYHLANIYQQQQNTKKALLMLEKKFQSSELLQHFYALQADIYFSLEDYEKSLEAIQQSVLALDSQNKSPNNFVKNLEIQNLMLLRSFSQVKAQIQNYQTQGEINVFLKKQLLLVKFIQKENKEQLLQEIKELFTRRIIRYSITTSFLLSTRTPTIFMELECS